MFDSREIDEVKPNGKEYRTDDEPQHNKRHLETKKRKGFKENNNTEKINNWLENRIDFFIETFSFGLCSKVK